MPRSINLSSQKSPAKVLFVFSLIIFIILSNASKTIAIQDEVTYKNLETFANVLSIIKKNYVEEINPEEVIQGAIKGMLTSLDPHSSYLKPENYKDLQVETKGNFSGIGIEITMKDGVLIVVSPIEGTPAAHLGIQAGDKIIKIEAEYTKGLTLMESVKMLRGSAGTKISLSIFRDGWTKLKEFSITRAVIPLHSVRSKLLEPGYGYIRITNFQAKTTRDTEDALSNLNKDEPLKGLVLDLRNNPGGLLNQAVKVSDLFINEGTIVSTKGRQENQNMQFKAHPKLDANQFPIIVLVNAGSASAAEIVAGALQDQKRAVLLGTKTFGKGSVQTVIPMNNGSALRLTTARYYTPNGTSIQAEGITPDFVVAREFNSQQKNESSNNQRIYRREKDLPHHIDKGDNQAKQEETAKKKTEVKKEQKDTKSASDNQLDMALMLLKGVNIFKK